MFISLFVVFANIHSEGIDLQDVLKEYADDVTEITLQEGEYFANALQLKSRNLTFTGEKDKVVLDLRDCDAASFDLENSSLVLASLTIQPSPNAAIASAQQESKLSISDCSFNSTALSKPFLLGSNSKLVISSTRLESLEISCSLIEGPADTLDPFLDLLVFNCHFSELTLKAQKPVLAGPEVQNVTISNSTFSDVVCKEDGPLPTEQVRGLANRSVVLECSSFTAVDGALSGGLVFGMQAAYLSLTDLKWYYGTNAVRFSNNVAFSESIEVEIVSSAFSNTKASEFWPNGGLLYLPHDTVKLTLSYVNATGVSAPEGHGGVICITGRSNLIIAQCEIKNSSAGKCGGFLYAANHVETASLNVLKVDVSRSYEDGGSIFLDSVTSFQANYGKFARSSTTRQGGAIFLNKSDNCTITFANVAFDENWAESGMGNDVLISYENGSNYNVNKKSFSKCTSSSRGHKVTLLPHTLHADWTNSAWLDVKAVIVGVVVGVCVFVAVVIVLTCVCCCCGCCVACGCGRKKADAYHHVESQPTTHYTPAQQHPNQYPSTLANPTQYPQQTMYAQPAAQPAQFQQYPNLPPSQLG
ncbi:hypothetical protein BLNAU_22728 [Blattamonas nauphoetae]|uniref:Right handed beta helix domain-containing protein n=1 Tax=Blattamonas nauphoetae TaxID=2049346 RepID=A0ABQ9WV82_9EUKA|nr:hypothetical protein BLNAU_22728 [Blattamonas nauphoetae]